MTRKRWMIVPMAACLLAGCVATAPVSIAWRSNTTLQYATTEGKNDRAADANTVNADRTTETQAALSTSSGTATTAPQDARNKAAQEAAQRGPCSSSGASPWTSPLRGTWQPGRCSCSGASPAS